MKKLFSVALALSLAGCNVIKPGLDAAKATLAAPPMAVGEAIKTLWDFMIQLVLGFAANVLGPLLGVFGL